MIYKTLAIALVLIVNACSTADTDPTSSIEEVANLQTKAFEEEVNHVYLEELHLMFLEIEYGGDHPLIPVYENLIDELVAGVKPGAGCPPAGPCNGEILNCKAFSYQSLERMVSFTQMYDVHVEFYNNPGQQINEIAGIETTTCPKPKSRDFYLAEPLEGDGYFNIRFASELTEGEMVEFTVPFIQE